MLDGRRCRRMIAVLRCHQSQQEVRFGMLWIASPGDPFVLTELAMFAMGARRVE